MTTIRRRSPAHAFFQVEVKKIQLNLKDKILLPTLCSLRVNFIELILLFQVIKTPEPCSGLLVEDLMPLCPLWIGLKRCTNAEVENRVKSAKDTEPRCSLDDFVLSRYHDMKFLLNRAVS